MAPMLCDAPLASARMQRPGPAVTAGVAAAGLAAAAIAWRALWEEPRSERVRERELGLGHRWPPALDGLRVALVSDLHSGAPHVGAERIERLVAAVNAQRPDLVLLLGDYIDPEVRFGSRVAPATVASRLGALRAPLGVAAVMGNHDWANEGPEMRAALRAAGIPVLENEAMRLGDVWVAGVDDTRHREPSIERALRDVPDGAATILLSHDPDLFPRVPGRVALTVSGHLHGGQVGVPLIRRPFIPSRFGERYARGHVVEDGRHLYVTAGFGTTGWPVRLFAPPEIVILRLSAAGAPPRAPDARPPRDRAPSRAAGRPPSSAPARRSG
jgi:predicted MPP superfamily phosphohydrolase